MSEGGGSKVGLYIGIAIGGCVLLTCCVGLAGGVGYLVWQEQQSSYYDWGTYDWGTSSNDWSNVSWGQIKITADSATVYSSNSVSSSVLETKSKGDKLEYYGWDDTFLYYKVKSGGQDGYVEMTKAEVFYE